MPKVEAEADLPGERTLTEVAEEWLGLNPAETYEFKAIGAETRITDNTGENIPPSFIDYLVTEARQFAAKKGLESNFFENLLNVTLFKVKDSQLPLMINISNKGGSVMLRFDEDFKIKSVLLSKR